jgi:hypothetical protein
MLLSVKNIKGADYVNCNNKYCVWCSFDQCCHEEEKAYKKATPNQLDCPVSTRVDWEYQFMLTIELLRNLGVRGKILKTLTFKKAVDLYFILKPVYLERRVENV